MRSKVEELGPPDLILFTGDMTFKGAKDEFAEVDRIFDEIREAVGGNPVLVPVPGNHDLRRLDENSEDAKCFHGYLDDEALRRKVDQGDQRTLEPIERMFSQYDKWREESVESDWRRRGLVFQRGLLPGDIRLTVTVRGTIPAALVSGNDLIAVEHAYNTG